MTASRVMEWGDHYALGIARMDGTHREFVDFYNELRTVTPERLFERLDAFIEHTAAHFAQENRWMEAVDFPACHREEHERVLKVMRDVRILAEKGDAFLGRRLLEELPPWFDNHIDTMDSALAHYLKEIGFDTETETLPEKKAAPAAPVEPSCGCAG